jgi:hypothetical protein
MITKEDLEASFLEDRKKLTKLREQIDSLIKERMELEAIVQSEETLLRGKFGQHLSQDAKRLLRIEPT